MFPSVRLPLGCTTCPSDGLKPAQQAQHKSQAPALAFAGKPDSFEKVSSKAVRENQSNPRFAGVFGPFKDMPSAERIYGLRETIDPEQGRVTYFALPTDTHNPRHNPDFYIATLDDAVEVDETNKRILDNLHDPLVKGLAQSRLRRIADERTQNMQPDDPNARH